MRRFIKRLVFSAICVTAATGIAQAVEFAQRAPEFPQRDYTCRLNGSDVKLGETRCLRTPQGRRLAVCGIALNMSTWRTGEGSCP